MIEMIAISETQEAIEPITDSELTEGEEDKIGDNFNELYENLKGLDKDCCVFTRQFQGYRKKLESQTLEEQELYPKRHAISWFKRHSIEIPCRLENFMDAFLKEEAAKDRICSEERTIILGRQGRTLFQTEKEKVGWMELLALLPNIFE